MQSINMLCLNSGLTNVLKLLIHYFENQLASQLSALSITYDIQDYLSVRFLVTSECISHIHTFVNIPALLLKNTLRFLMRAGILTKV